MSSPLVSVIVVCHNQGDYVKEAVISAFIQTYPNIEVLVVDDASTDHSDKVIQNLWSEGYQFTRVSNSESLGYCKAFNKGLALSTGEYIIDLAADDILLPERVEAGMSSFVGDVGVDFCDAYYIDHNSEISGTHYRRDDQGNLLDHVVEGHVFSEILRRYYICTPTMMMDRSVLEKLGGYDEELYYEDFDFWVRSSKLCQYHYTDRKLVKKRVLADSMSKSQYLPHSKMLPTTLRVCEKAYDLCKSEEEFKSLTTRLRYEIRQSVISNNYQVASGFYKLLASIQVDSLETRFWSWIISRQWNLSFLTRLIRQAR